MSDALDPTADPHASEPPASGPSAAAFPYAPRPGVEKPDRGRVLIIEDEPSVTEVVQLYLEDAYEVSSASSGRQGLALARTLLPDLVLLDIGLPDINGYEVCRTLKEEPGTQDIPIIFLTAFGSVEDQVRGLQAGAVDYIAKPVTPPLLEARVAAHMELKQQRDYLHALCRLDGLTGIYNRRGLDDVLGREWRRAARAHEPLSFVLMDIDRFKSFNDLYGHIAGDDCLKLIADALRQVPRRGGDVVARYGGEEFAAVLPNTPGAAAGLLGERFRAVVEALAVPHAGAHSAGVVTLSVGIATAVPHYGSESMTLVEAADRRLFEVKAHGGNAVTWLDLGETPPETPCAPVDSERAAHVAGS